MERNTNSWGEKTRQEDTDTQKCGDEGPLSTETLGT